MRERIAFVKTGWSDDYQGGEVAGRHAHIAEFHEAHERFNFLQAKDGRFYGYLPPIGHAERPPQPRREDGWLVIFVAARNGNGPLTVVGWYEGATFQREYTERPEYRLGIDFETDANDERFLYCVSSDRATLIPVSERERTIPGDHFKRAPIIYARGNGGDDPWRRKLAREAEDIVKWKKPRRPTGPPTVGFPDKAHRDKVEKASMTAASEYLREKSYRLRDRTKANCGYDILAKRGRAPKELHVEVKGTSGDTMRFFMTRNERRYMRNPKWRLIIVTNALNNPKIVILTRQDVERTFEFDALAWEATAKSK